MNSSSHYEKNDNNNLSFSERFYLQFQPRRKGEKVMAPWEVTRLANRTAANERENNDDDDGRNQNGKEDRGWRLWGKSKSTKDIHGNEEQQRPPKTCIGVL